MREPEQVLPPEVRERIANLSLEARRAALGVLSGMHRSPHRGASVVFVEHREYRPGDDVRLLDWRAYARSDRHTIKRFEQETQLRATLVLDASASMDYGEGTTKAEHAATLLAALGLVLVRQGDAAGVVRFAREVIGSLPSRSRPAHLELILGELARPIAKDASTDLRAALALVAERAGRRGVVAVASDLLDFGDHALGAIDRLVHRGHDVLVFQVMHRDELELPFEGPTRFLGLEGEEALDVDPTALREGYLRELGAFLDACRARCTAAGARYRLVRTDEPVERVLAEVLAGAGRRS
ncbi:MAG: DUF58 domain-containing protein [Myxococcota bacterium]|nr:DUF58 domain-containing protein [Myxococcota bacterium]